MWVLGPLYIAAVLAAAHGQRYFAMMPNEVRNDMDYRVDVTLLTPQNAMVTFEVSIMNSGMSGALWSSPSPSAFNITINGGQMTGNGAVKVPYSVPAGSKCKVQLRSIGLGKEIIETRDVDIVRPIPPIFIQTDKPIYQPKQIVRYRVLSANPDLKIKQEALQVIIKDAKDNTIMDKTADPTAADFNGLVQDSFELSDDPIKGVYTISASTSTSYTEATFEVKEYVLPKFEVTVSMKPSYGTYNNDLTVSGTVDAKYTYGKQVQGQLEIMAYYGGMEKTVQKKIEFSGSYDFNFGLYDLIVLPQYGGDASRFIPPYQPSGEVQIFAKVYEAHTNTEQNETAMYTVYAKDFKATPVDPIPLLFDGATAYSFELELTDPRGNALKETNWSQYTISYSVNYRRTVSSVAVTGQRQLITIDDADVNNIQVWYVRGREESIKADVVPVKYYSGSKTTLSVSMVESSNQDERCFKIGPAYMSGDKVYYQIINAFYPESVRPYTKPEGHCFTVTKDHAPASMVVAYKVVAYPDPDTKDVTKTEMLTASVIFETPWTSSNQVSMEVDGSSTVEPGDEVNLVVQAAASSWVCTSGLDKRVELLSENKNVVTMSKLIEAVENYRMFSRPKENPFPNPPWIRPMFVMEGERVFRKKRCLGCWGGNGNSIDPIKLLKEAGLLIVTDLSMYESTNTPPDYGDYRVFFMANAGGDMDENEEVDATDEKQGAGPIEAPKPAQTRKNFEETWLWEMERANSDGALMLTSKIPDSITSWTVNAFAFNAEKGIGVANPVTVTVFKEFFISMNLPYSIVRRENVTLQVLVFNYREARSDNNNGLLQAKVRLDNNNRDYQVLGPDTVELEIPSGQSGLAQYNVIVSEVVGEVTLLATATDNIDGTVDRVERKLRVKAEGREVVKSDNLKLSDITSGQTQTASFNMSKLFPQEDRAYFVEGSLRMYLKATGDIMGPFIENLEGHIRMPTGCGEQNIQTLTPSLFAGRYLNSIDRLDQESQAKIEKVCGFGYRKELIYKHSDGSYSAFGESSGLCGCMGGAAKKGSTWLTADVLKMFSLLKKEEFTYVAPEELKHMFDYMKTTVRENCDDQFFVELGELIHKEMMGGSESRIGFTAFCTMALLDYRATLPAGETRNDVDAVITMATDWILARKQRIYDTRNKLQAAVSAYVLAKACESSGNEKCKEAIHLLDASKTWDGPPVEGECMADKLIENPERSEVCTSVPEDPNRPYNCDQCCRMPCSDVKVCKSRGYSRHGSQDSGPSKTETAGYQVLAYLALHETSGFSTEDKNMYESMAEGLVNGLRREMGFDGLWHSTQDTAVALEALSSYAYMFPDGMANFRVEAKQGSTVVSAPIFITPSNYTVNGMEKLDIPAGVIPSTIDAQVSGSSGTAYVNLVAMYNLNSNITNKAIVITGGPMVTVNGETYIHTCVSANPNSNVGVSTMALVEVEMPTGSQVSSVDGGNDSKTSPIKVEIKEDSVVFYYESVTLEERCTKVLYNQVFEVQDPQPRSLTGIDYYQPDQNTKVFYTVSQKDIPCSDCPTTGASGIHMSASLLCALLALTLVAMRMQIF
ncbi:pregnancy zone protein-like isoform X2 [Mya arenaria]|uniref:pregnancy zone protein-like isoform X2 n=1 Tax=Mya arenaria TaxID=6604 RepID=UPI0022E834AC|nr:pregnancy zone protein-like isoform X2 [Mya arenaria]